MHFSYSPPFSMLQPNIFTPHINRIKSVWPVVWLLYWKVTKKDGEFSSKEFQMHRFTTHTYTHHCLWHKVYKKVCLKHSACKNFFLRLSKWVKICNGNIGDDDDVGNKILSMKTNKFFIKKETSPFNLFTIKSPHEKVFNKW